MRKLAVFVVLAAVLSVMPLAQASLGYNYGTDVQGTSVTYLTIDADWLCCGNAAKF